MYRSTLHESDHEPVLSTLRFKSITRPPICPPLTELVANLLWLNHLMTSSLPSTLSVTHSKPQFRRPVSLYFLPQDLVTQTWLPMKSATYPTRSKKPGYVLRMHHPKTSLDSSVSTTISKGLPKLQLRKHAIIGGAKMLSLQTGKAEEAL